ncbi:MAG: WD40 repeat domain-containing protein [Ignavibacteria bacterium]
MSIFRCIAVFTTWLLMLAPALTQVSVEIRDLRPNGITIDTLNYPLLRAWLRANVNGSPYTFGKSELSIVESNFSSKAISVAQPDGQGYQEVTWMTRSEGANRAEFIIATNTGTGSSPLGKHDRGNISQMRFCDPFGIQIEEFNFGSAVLPGSSDYTTLLVRAIAAKKNNRGVEVNTQLDSITFSSPDFSYRWIGSYVSTQPPPVGIAASTGYYFDIIFKPSRTGYYKEYAVLHYEGGQKDYLLLRANGFGMPETRSLTITEPNANITLTPCAPYTVKWKGYRIGAPTYVDWSPDNGKTWDTLGFSMDSTFLWKTPGIITDSGRIRIRQELGNFDQKNLTHPALRTPVSTIDWNSVGDKLIAGYESGKIAEWNKVDGMLIDTFVVSGISFPVSKIQWIGIGYINDTLVYGVYRSPATSQETFVLFRKGKLDPILSSNISSSTILNSVHRIKNELLLIPKRGRTIRKLSIIDGKELTGFTFAEPITAFSPGNGDKGSIALLDGSIHVIDLNTMSIITTLSNPALPLMAKVSLSRDGAFLAAGTMLSESSLYSSASSEVHVFDIASKTIVRSLRNSSSDVIALDFNATNQFLATGFAGFPQISVWRLPTNVFLGQLANHSGFLTDVKYGPDGKSLASSAISADNLKTMEFAFPETDTATSLIRIEPSKPIIVSADLGDAIMMHPTDSILKVNLCNGGKGDIFIDYAYFREGIHFSLISKIPNTVKIAPGDCIDIGIRVLARDNGPLIDSLFFGFCSQEFFLPIKVNGVLRSINPLAQGKKLGPACLNETIQTEIELIRNDDPVPVTINRLQTKSPAIKILSSISDTILQPGQSLSVKVLFSPKQLGEELIEVLAYHSGLTLYEVPIVLKGYGDGTDVAVPGVIACIPELKQRTFTLSNASMNEVRLDSVIITGSAFTLATALPLILPARSQKDITITFTGTLPDSGEIMSCSFYPCATAKSIRIIPYSAKATITLPQLKADPRGRASMPITISVNERNAYSGKQEAIVEFTSNQGIFLPDTVTSTFGVVSIMSREVWDDTRTTRIRFEGAIPKVGTLCVISGFVGISNVHESPLVFADSVTFFSKSMQTNFVNGSLQLSNICPELFLTGQRMAKINGIFPQPAHDHINLSVQVFETSEVKLMLTDQLGRNHEIMKYPMFAGDNAMQFTIPPQMESGAYILKLMSATSIVLDAIPIHIIR